ncbi:MULTISPECIES: CvpA family protein [Flagellimonas]|jgi:membrane protein required for colicin V production|uniref:CvpA family protein n=1 Tax=Flagellimonas TaxID=444459 RepID=UPI001CD24B17|nr:MULTISPECIES: CvpA family protein [Allomuricauda]MCA0958832.1 CvpA family protein [Allomuricauda ruestringensis]USD26437.1 CvpA family protein [Allomuricauda aquimarina]
MSFLDIIIGILLIWGLYKGLKNGLFVELASLIALIAGIYGAIHFSHITGDYLAAQFDWSEQYLKIAAFLITFFVIIVTVNLAGKILTKIADFAMLGLLNKVAGGIFGALKVAVILGAFLIFFEKLTTPLGLINEETKEDSVFYEPIKDLGDLIFSYVFDDEKTIPSDNIEATEEII